MGLVVVDEEAQVAQVDLSELLLLLISDLPRLWSTD